MPRENFYYSLTCTCGVTGTAHGTDNDNGPNFRIESVSDDFREVGQSRNPTAVQFAHRDCPGLVSYSWG